MKSNLLFAVLTGLIVISCAKNDRVSGRITNSLTGEPLANVQVNLEALNSGLGADKTSGLKHLNSGVTASDGTYSIPFRFKENKRSLFQLSIESSQLLLDTTPLRDVKYMVYGSGTYGNVLARRSHHLPEKNNDFSIAPTCRIMLRGSGSALSYYDRLNVTLYTDNVSYSAGYYPNYPSGSSSGTPYFSGFNQYTSLPCNGKVYVKWDVQKSNSTKTYYDTIRIEPFAKTIYTVKW